jgi:hypothetical protein
MSTLEDNVIDDVLEETNQIVERIGCIEMRSEV